MADLDEFLVVGTLVLVRISGVMIFSPFFSSEAIPRQVKIGFSLVLAWLLMPIAANLPGVHAELSMVAVLSELTTGLIFGLSLSLLMEILGFAGQVLGFQFSFSLVNVLDPNSSVETPLLSQLLNLLGVLVILAAGLDRTLLSAFMRTFIAVPIGTAWLSPHTSLRLIHMASGIFLAGVQLAAPVLGATLLVELAIALVGRLSPQLPVMFVGIPMKTLIGYTVLIGSLGIWPRFIEAHFDALLNQAMQMTIASHGA
jgi:flagellar biosynthetic protein FliR